MKTAFPAAAPRPFREIAPASPFHRVAEEHLRKLLAETIADIDIALGLCRPEDTQQNAILMRAWNRLVGQQRRTA